MALRGPVSRLPCQQARLTLRRMMSSGRYVILCCVQSGKKSTEVCLLDLNEAVGAVVPKYSNTGILDNDMPANCAERVVAGARALAPYLENRMLAVKLLDKPAVLRELMPQDLWKSTRSPAKRPSRRRGSCRGLWAAPMPARWGRRDAAYTGGRVQPSPLAGARRPVLAMVEHCCHCRRCR